MTRDPFANYDAWLEAPFQRMCAEQDRYESGLEAFAEAEGLDPDDPATGTAFDEWNEAEEEAAAEAAYEAHLEAKADEMYDRGEW